MQYRILFTSLSLLIVCSGFSQTLSEYVKSGVANNFSVQLSRNWLMIAEANYSVFTSSTRPTLSINGNIPVYNKDNYGITQPDGTIKFLRRSQNYSNAGFSISQPLAITGGTISLNTDLYRFDDFVTNTKQYNGTPVFLQLQQPLFGYNRFKWDRQIEPLKFEEAKLSLALEINQLAADICKTYFDVIDAQTSRQLAQTNLQNCITNLNIERRRVQLGTSTEDRVLQLEIQELNNRREFETADLAIQTTFSQLNLLINNNDTSSTWQTLPLPIILPVLELPLDKLIEQAKKNLPAYIVFQRKLLESKSNTNLVKAQNNQVNLVASYGLTNAASSITSIYQNPNNQQRFSLGFTVPLVTWGKRKNSITAARLQEKHVALTNKAYEAKLIAEITNLLKVLPLLQKNVYSALRIDTLTQRRFAITNRLFQSGKNSLLELQAAQTEKDNARRNYILALRKFWETWYLLKSKTNDSKL
jgi:outer membrane protein